MNKLFERTGAHVLVDGQFGSTGKGALASWLALHACNEGDIRNFDGAISSAGPNSGHTSYYGSEKIVLHHLPTFAVHAHLLGHTIPVYLSAGAIINVSILKEEAERFSRIPIYVHPQACVVNEDDIETETTGEIRKVAGTRSGTGAAMIRKISRYEDAVWVNQKGMTLPGNITTMRHNLKPWEHAYFVEVAQGFSLGINSEFYPKVTSRECTVMQAIADARIPPRHVTKTYMCIRTYPIRVGNVDGFNSGDWYHDQVETTWDKIGVPEERTTVTNRVRRVASFSDIQFYEAMRANDPDWVFVSHLDYESEEGQNMLIEELKEYSSWNGGCKEFGLIGGYGPTVKDIKVL